ncbi:hypothetical protein [Dyadobacter sp. CY323]|uniref:hypothetical protein n=1 Tax=Dyadobacter sp. CY323 TaxID=2907302 RepID=UPI001F3882A2|nr:hypothetical protein [Dyadobacter sp. CY323]MCE6991854.1 hypothetical protein [Dyadobacter sp. CY323]
MASRLEVERFLAEFYVKYNIFDIRFISRTSTKNVDTLVNLEVSTLKRRQIIESLTVANYVAGPIDDVLYGIASLWVFGYRHNGHEIYIKISLGHLNLSVTCISFHIAEHPMFYPFN